MNKFILFAAAMLMIAAGANAQQKVGYVNSTKIFSEIPEAADAQKRLEALAKPIQDEIEKREKEIDNKLNEYKQKEALMNDAAKRTAQQEIYDMDQKLREYKLQKNEELGKQQDKIINPIKDKILKAIEAIAKAEKYTFVFDQTENVRVLLYGDPREDLTNRVIDRLKRGK